LNSLDLPRRDTVIAEQEGKRDRASDLQEFLRSDGHRARCIARKTVPSRLGATKAGRGKASIAQRFGRGIYPALCKAARTIDADLKFKGSDLAECRKGQGCGVLVTSRKPLSALDGATVVKLKILSPEDAITLVQRLVRSERSIETNEKKQVTEKFVQLCG